MNKKKLIDAGVIVGVIVVGYLLWNKFRKTTEEVDEGEKEVSKEDADETKG